MAPSELSTAWVAGVRGRGAGRRGRWGQHDFWLFFKTLVTSKNQQIDKNHHEAEQPDAYGLGAVDGQIRDRVPVAVEPAHEGKRGFGDLTFFRVVARHVERADRVPVAVRRQVDVRDQDEGFVPVILDLRELFRRRDPVGVLLGIGIYE